MDLDSGASDHIIENKGVFPSLDYGSFHPSVTFISSLQGIGVVNATSSLSL